MPANPLSVHEELRAAYLRYFDTAFWLRDPRLMAERRRLLEDSSLLFTDPLIEPVLPYDATVPLAEVCEQAGISTQTGEVVGRALFGAFTPPGSPVHAARPPGRGGPALLPARDGRRPQRHRHLGDRVGQDRELPAAGAAATRRGVRVVGAAAWSAPLVGRPVDGILAAKPWRRNPPGRGPGAGPLPDERAGRRPDGPAAARRAPDRRGRRAEQALVRQVHRQHAGRRRHAGARERTRGSSTPPSSCRR